MRIALALIVVLLFSPFLNAGDPPTTRPDGGATTLPSDSSRVLRARFTGDQNPAAVVVSGPLPKEDDAVVKLFSESIDKNRALDDAGHLTLLATGPALDSPDQAVVSGASWDQQNGVIKIAMSYTSARVRGVPLLQNYRWWPLLFFSLPGIPADGPWPCRVQVTWNCSDVSPNGEKAPAPVVVKILFQVGVKK